MSSQIKGLQVRPKRERGRGGGREVGLVITRDSPTQDRDPQCSEAGDNIRTKISKEQL